jgi:hypothetical protein
MPTSTNYVLIDFENVQPRNLELLRKHPFEVFGNISYRLPES